MKKFKWKENLIYFLGVLFLLLLTVLNKTLSASTSQVPSLSFQLLRKNEIMSRLKLTDQQRELIHQSRAAYRKKIAELNTLFTLEKSELKMEMEKPDPNMDQLESCCRKIGWLKGLQLKEKTEAYIELKNKILTPRQLDVLSEIQQRNPKTAFD